MANLRSDGLQLVWFKRDLRVADHVALGTAAARGPVLPLFIAEPDIWSAPDMSARQWAFVCESLAELRTDLAALGQPLILRVGQAVPVLDRLHRDHRIAAIHSHEETGNALTYARDRAVGAWCRTNTIPWHEYRQTGVIRRIATRDGWARRWDMVMAEPIAPPPQALMPVAGIDAGAIPGPADLGLAPDPCPGRQAGGRMAGLERLDSFLTARGKTYRTAMSSPVTAFDACSRLSPHLAWGTLSMREASQATRRRRAEKPGGAWTGALGSFAGRLHWHCHFMQKLEDAPRIEWENLHPGYAGLRPAEPDPARLAAWQAGETGLPFVDACMRALAATGWMNFRMRAMLMAVSSYHLWLDWRRPGEHLARLFTDYEPGIHWPQVQMQSGTTGINTIRIYNPVKQGQDQDPDGRFTRRWLPELAEVPDRHLHTPWTWDDAGRILGRTYPFPVVDHLDAARSARQKVWAVRGSDSFRAEAGRIQERHGSRKSGIPMTGARKKGRTAGPEQPGLPFGTA